MSRRITFLLRALERGGAEVQLVHLARGLQARGHTISVVTFYPGGPLEAPLVEAGVALHASGKRGRWDTLGFMWRLRRLIRAQQPDILHSYLVPPNLVSGLLRPTLGGTRVVWGLRASDMDMRHYDWTHAAAFRLQCRLARLPDLTIANSYAGRDHAVANGFPAASVQVVANGIDTARFQSDPAARRRMREEWQLSEKQRVVGMVGRLDPMKDHASFLQAAARLADVHGDVRFVCAGGGPQATHEQLAAMTRALGLEDRVRWLGSRDDVADVLNGFDVATLTSAFGEGFPNVIGEAMATGLPVVATDVGDAAVIVDDPAFMVPRREPEALATAWTAALALTAAQRLTLADRNRARIEAEFSLSRMVERTETLYLSLPGQAASAA